jgi:hypothetical protein
MQAAIRSAIISGTENLVKAVCFINDFLFLAIKWANSYNTDTWSEYQDADTFKLKL